MATMIQLITDLASAMGTDVKTLRNAIGTLSSLTTTQKGNLVAALNELKAAVDAAASSGGAAIDDATARTSTVYSSSKVVSLLGGKVDTSRTVNGKPLSSDVVLAWSDFSGLIPSSALPPLAISDVFSVATQAAMLALTAQRGDIAVRTDVGKTFILSADDATTLANWIEVPAIGQVQSVAGKTGAISLVIADISGLQAALDGKASTAAATTTLQGIVELATSAETVTGTDAVRAVTPAGLQAVTGDLSGTTPLATYNAAKA